MRKRINTIETNPLAPPWADENTPEAVELGSPEHVAQEVADLQTKLDTERVLAGFHAKTGTKDSVELRGWHVDKAKKLQRRINRLADPQQELFN